MARDVRDEPGLIASQDVPKPFQGASDTHFVFPSEARLLCELKKSEAAGVIAEAAATLLRRE